MELVHKRVEKKVAEEMGNDMTIYHFKFSNYLNMSYDWFRLKALE